MPSPSPSVPFSRLALLLLAAAPLGAQQSEREFPNDWYWHKNERQWAQHAALLGKPMPRLDLSEWRNGEVDLQQDLAGKVVVVDFWATWCGPCLQSIPHNNELYEAHKTDGLVFLGICGSNRGQENMDAVIAQRGIRYPVARDAAERSGPAWRVLWWPTYAVVDRQGMVRAIGLRPDHVADVVQKLLAEPVPAVAAAVEASDAAADTPAAAPAAAPADALPPVPASWLEANPQRDSLLAQLTNRPAPALRLRDWQQTEGLGADAPDWNHLRGKVVLLDFWATWCGPCIRSIPHTNELQAKYRDRGFAVIGVCHPRKGEAMAATAKQHGIDYAIGLDAEGRTIESYGVNSFPDYYLIDRQGRLRVADCTTDSLEAAIEQLLAEAAPSPAPPKIDDRPGDQPGDGGK